MAGKEDLASLGAAQPELARIGSAQPGSSQPESVQPGSDADERELLRRRLEPLTRILNAAKDRYVELGGVRGRLAVAKLTDEERLALVGLLGDFVRARAGETLSLRLVDLDLAIRERNIAAGLKEVLELIEDGRVETFPEQRVLEARRWEELIGHLAERSAGVESSVGGSTGAGASVASVASGASGASGESGASVAPGTNGLRSKAFLRALVKGEGLAFPIVKRQFRQEEGAGERQHRPLRQALQSVEAALDRLPADAGTTTWLPVFAREITGDPHGLDEPGLTGRLLVRALADLLGPTCGMVGLPEGSLERGNASDSRRAAARWHFIQHRLLRLQGGPAP